MKHYTFATKTLGLLDVLESASYAIFTKVNEDGYVTGYAQGSFIPSKIEAIRGSECSKDLRKAFADIENVTETGVYATMGKCQACDCTHSTTWSPWHCDRCFVKLKM
jgi:hypothetical protein